MIVLNYVTCVPVLLCVGGFRYELRFFVFFETRADLNSLYHISCLLNNTTTIEGWEKDKVATLVRNGKIREIKFPYVIISCHSL
jgi:hypothetical protein